MNSARIEAFRQGLRELGYVEGQNVLIEHRTAEGKIANLPKLVAELIALKVDVIVAVSIRAAQAAKQATKTIPIVATSGDPVGAGLVESLARPGGNVTGLANLSYDVAAETLRAAQRGGAKIFTNSRHLEHRYSATRRVG